MPHEHQTQREVEPKKEHGPGIGARPHLRAARSTKPHQQAAIGNDHEKHARDLIRILNSQDRLARSELAGSGAASVAPERIHGLVTTLVQVRSALSSSLTLLESGSDLQIDAFDACDRATETVERLEALERSSRAGEALHIDRSHEDANALDRVLAERSPPSYCDLSTTQQGIGPCTLDPSTRERYRRGVLGIAQAEHTTWIAAINGVLVDEKLAPKIKGVEAKIGGILLDILFQCLPAVGTSLVRGAVGAVGKAMTKPDPFIPGLTEGPSQEALGTVIAAGTWVVKQAASFGKDNMKTTLTNRALSERVRIKALNGHVPKNNAEFLTWMRDAPTEWYRSVLENVPQLVDGDLKALFGTMGEPRTQGTFEDQIRATLAQFDQQVLAVDFEHRPIKVVTSSGARYAMATYEKQPNFALHGEWRGTPTRTGRWTFVRWIDDAFADMAVQRAATGDPVHDPWAGSLMATPNDRGFWDEASIDRMRRDLQAGAS